MALSELDCDQALIFGKILTEYMDSNCAEFYQYPSLETEHCHSDYSEMTTSSNLSDLSDYSEPESYYTELIPIKHEQFSEYTHHINPNLISYPNPQDDASDDSSVILDPTDIEFLTCPSNTQTHELNEYVTGDCFDETCVNHDTYYEEVVDESRLPSFSKLVSSIQSKKQRCSLSSSEEAYISEEDDDNVVIKKGKRGAKNVLLWKFLLEQLLEGENLIRWIDQRFGTFRFVDTIEISRRWGAKKRKNDMNFEKLSRAIRHYYRTGFMSRCEGTRLVYKINWRMVPKQWRKKFFIH